MYFLIFQVLVRTKTTARIRIPQRWAARPTTFIGVHSFEVDKAVKNSLNKEYKRGLSILNGWDALESQRYLKNRASGST